MVEMFEEFVKKAGLSIGEEWHTSGLKEIRVKGGSC
jgi:hypothetical protein